MNWDRAVAAVAPYVVRIETPNGYGTGFLAFYNLDKSWCGVATAAHIVAHADDWQQPIKIMHAGSPSPPLILHQPNRMVVLDRANDSAIIFFSKSILICQRAL